MGVRQKPPYDKKTPLYDKSPYTTKAPPPILFLDTLV